jgi:hypothetical protein
VFLLVLSLRSWEKLHPQHICHPWGATLKDWHCFVASLQIFFSGLDVFGYGLQPQLRAEGGRFGADPSLHAINNQQTNLVSSGATVVKCLKVGERLLRDFPRFRAVEQHIENDGLVKVDKGLWQHGF